VAPTLSSLTKCYGAASGNIARPFSDSSTCEPALAATMKRMEFTESQIAEILCEARRTPVNDVARKHNITEATIHAWRGKFGQLGAEDIKRLRHLKNAHARRQKLVAKRS
jgi:putative transposase